MRTSRSTVSTSRSTVSTSRSAVSTSLGSTITSLSPVSTSPISSPPVNSGNAEQDHSPSLSGGVIGGITVGAVAIIVGMIALLFLSRHFRRSKLKRKIHTEALADIPELAGVIPSRFPNALPNHKAELPGDNTSMREGSR